MKLEFRVNLNYISDKVPMLFEIIEIDLPEYLDTVSTIVSVGKF